MPPNRLSHLIEVPFRGYCGRLQCHPQIGAATNLGVVLSVFRVRGLVEHQLGVYLPLGELQAVVAVPVAVEVGELGDSYEIGDQGSELAVGLDVRAEEHPVGAVDEDAPVPGLRVGVTKGG